jgi:hypothetical protein
MEVCCLSFEQRGEENRYYDTKINLLKSKIQEYTTRS